MKLRIKILTCYIGLHMYRGMVLYYLLQELLQGKNISIQIDSYQSCYAIQGASTAVDVVTLYQRGMSSKSDCYVCTLK